ncbi:carbonic anhydrase [Dendrothele bispora CBS 962.96]|uniref:Carbonic anhydrase n=1 Tax=Dendrothele bispora (strain CBS 962.96) TaxID=1314807 RepID=A0A4S8MET1_DENBC|nr:carbonic anhydrase [Dendrothele bispora CBS 962.96]
MSTVYESSPAIPSQDLLDRNAAYAEGHKPKLGQHNWGNFPKNAIITCMDCRLHPNKQLGLADHDTTIIRNAGGDVSELIGTIVVTQNFGTRHFILIKHTDCGGFYTKREELVKNFKANAKNPDAIDELPGAGNGFGGLKIEEVVNHDVEILRKSPLIYPDTVISGWVFDDSTGKIRQVN